MMMGAAPTSPSRPSAIRACATTRGERSASAARNGAASTPFSSVLRSASAAARTRGRPRLPASFRKTPCDPAPSSCLSANKGRDATVQGRRRIGRQIGEGSGRLRRRTATEDLALAMEARGRIGAAQARRSARAGASPFGSTGEVGLQPGGRHAREEADLRADVDARLAPAPARHVEPAVARRCPCPSAGGWSGRRSDWRGTRPRRASGRAGRPRSGPSRPSGGAPR